MGFRCLYCGGEDYVEVGHWKTCPTCTPKSDPKFWKWVLHEQEKNESHALLVRSREYVKNRKGMWGGLSRSNAW